MKPEVKKLLILNLPYLLFVYLFDKVGAAIRLSPGADASGKLLHLGEGFSAAFSSIAPSFHPADLLIGMAGAVIVRLVVYFKGKNAKKYRKGMEYVDSFGYKDVPEFLQEQKQLTPDDLETGEKIQTPRGSFHVTAMSREQMEAAGYGVHHTSDDGKYFIMGNGTRAFAVAAEPPENHLKAAEQTTEQNANMIDGIINNEPPAPTVEELEAKVKAGETISLVDLANAVKADKENGKEAKPKRKPSIWAQLKADKEKAQKKTAKQKSQDLERS